MVTQPFVNKTPNFAVGTASVNNGSTTVSFSGANLLQTDPTTGITYSACSVGDVFNVPGIGAGIIQSVDSTSQITLATPWAAASQTNRAYTIYRYSTPAQGVLLEAVNNVLTQGQDSNPDLSETIDDGTARFKIRNDGGIPSLAVGPTGTADASLKNALQIDPASAVVSFPNGAVPPGDWSVNRIINGGFDIWQEGTTFTVNINTGRYTADQWRLASNGIGALTVNKVVAPTGFSSQYAVNITITGAVINKNFFVAQRFESAQLTDLVNSDCVLSFDLVATTTAGKLNGQINIYGNTSKDDGTFNLNLYDPSFSVPAGVSRIAMPIPANKTTGFANGAYISITIWQVNASGNVNATIGAVKLEKGIAASDWASKPIAQEWRDCMRFYYQCDIAFAGRSSMAGVNYLETATSFPVPMRASPVMSVYNFSGDAGASSSPGFVYATSTGAMFRPTITGANQYYRCGYIANARL
jgi:hypothetical protein